MSSGRGADNAEVHQLTRRSLADVLRNRGRRDGRTDDGFSLIELMIALFVFALLASGFAVTMSGTLKAFQRARAKTLGEQIANDQLENARRMPYLSLGNVAGNPIGIIPMTVVQSVGGYSFNVATDVSFVSDPVAISIATGADYKRVVVTVASIGLGAPPVTMSTLVAPPAKPAGDRGQVQVQVHDAVTNGALAGIGVDLKHGAVLQHDLSDLNGNVSFPDLPPSAVIGPTPAPGVNDWYYVNAGTTTGFTLPTDYYVHPNSDSSYGPAFTNKFTLPPGTAPGKALNIYKAAAVTLQLTDNEGNALLDPAVLTFTSDRSLPLPAQPSYGTIDIPILANTILTQFKEAPAGLGIIPDGTYTYSVDAGGGCTWPTTSIVVTKNATYPTSTAFAIPNLKMPCSYSDVTIHLTDGVTGAPLAAGTTVTVADGPFGVTKPPITTNASGNATIKLRSGATAYSATVPAQSGHAQVKIGFSVTSVTTPPVNISVPRLQKVITVTLRDGFSNNVVNGATVQIAGGPPGVVIPDGTTNASGQYVVNVPYGTSYPNYTVTVLPFGGRNGASGIADASALNVAVDLLAQWPTTKTVNITLAGANAGTGPILNTDFTLTGGPANGTTLYNSGPTGTVPITVPLAAGPNYVITVAADGAGRLLKSVNFAPTAAGVVNTTVSITWTTVTITIPIRRANGNNLYNTQVKLTGGPANFSAVTNTPNNPTTTNVTFTVPIGTTPYSITVPAYAGQPAVLWNVPGPGNTTVTPNILVIGA